MKVGDLVKSLSDGCFGTVVAVRKTKWQQHIGMVKVYWPDDNATILHSVGQLEVINEK
jgi:hypothetical protein